jgi:ankyrin repeat protein
VGVQLRWGRTADDILSVFDAPRAQSDRYSRLRFEVACSIGRLSMSAKPAFKKYVVTGAVFASIMACCVTSGLLMIGRFRGNACELVEAIASGDDDRIERMIAAGQARKPCLESGLVEIYPLHAAAAVASPTIMEKLLLAGADPGCRDWRGSSPIQSIFWQYGDGKMAQRRECLECLLRFGADIDASDVEGRSTIHVAAGNPRQEGAEAVRMLIEMGADANALTRGGSTPLHVAAGQFRAKGREVVIVLLESGADPSIRNKRGETALDLAKQLGVSEIVAILQRGGNPATSTE